MTNFKILITDEGPVVIDAPVKPIEEWTGDKHNYSGYTYGYQLAKKNYQQALASIISDRSKYIQFLFGDRITIDQFYDYKLKHGDIEDIPKGYQLEFKERCGLGKHDEPTCANIESCICVHDGIKVKRAVLVPIKEKTEIDMKITPETAKGISSAHTTESSAQEEDIKCPFCEMNGFDKIGFKDHLIWCDDYHKTEVL